MKATIALEDQVDIKELEDNIQSFRDGKFDEERFKLYRLTRGVYGQRQLGVQMFRIKIPAGTLSSGQLLTIADASEKYGSGNLHLTTRQDIQLHYVRLDDSPAVWTLLAQNNITAREACGNTVRNITCSDTAGIDPEELFDVTPYTLAVTDYFLRYPINQEMGRKIKIAFSSTEKDTAFTFFHDFGFIPKIETINNKATRGFKVLVGGGLGAVAIPAQVAYDFLPADQLIPFLEAGLRVFDRYGEREKRQKARLKFLIKKLGLEGFLKLVKEERAAVKHKSYEIDTTQYSFGSPKPPFKVEPIELSDNSAFERWKRTNVINQKQEGFHAVYIKVRLGDISHNDARKLAPIIKKYSSDDIRITINQNLLVKYIHTDHLPNLYEELHAIGYADDGYDSIADVTACPGTDTCNLGVTNSTGLARVIENHIRHTYPELLEEKHIKIKISGCMNACGQHMIANIGFHGSSIKKDNKVIPAMQVVLGGGIHPNGEASIADKVIKLPTKKIIEALDIMLLDFEEKAFTNEYFNDYYQRHGKKYFYELLKGLANTALLKETDLFDWEQDHLYQQAIGVGECAGVILDVIGTILKDAQTKLEKSKFELTQNNWAESIYYSYNTHVTVAKAILLSNDIKCNTQSGIINDFQTLLIEERKFPFSGNFKEHVLGIKSNEPSESYANYYNLAAEQLLKAAINYNSQDQGKLIIESYYKA